MPVLEDPEAWPDIEKTLLSLGELLAGLDAKFLVLIDDEYTHQHTGEPVAAVTLDQDAWKILIDTTHAAADAGLSVAGLVRVVCIRRRLSRLREEDCPTFSMR